LVYNRTKGKDALPIDEVQSQMSMQVNELNRLIQDPTTGTPQENWARIRGQMEQYELAAQGNKKAIEAVEALETASVAARGKAIRDAGLEGTAAADGLAALHRLDSGLGGNPSDIARIGNARVNSMLGGGNVIRLRGEILRTIPATTVPHFTARYNPNAG
jgi:hypothetical protein